MDQIERDRIAALNRYTSVLGEGADEVFDDVTRLLVFLCKVPIAAISFVDVDRQWFKSEYGLGVHQIDRVDSICSDTIRQSGLMEIRDLSQHPRYSTFRFVAGEPWMRFYAAAPIRTSDDRALGTVLIVDYVERELQPEERDLLLFMSRQVMARLDLLYALEVNRQAAFERENLLIAAQTARAASEHANSMKDEFLATLSHELRTPLNAILGWVQILRREVHDDHRLDDELEIIERNARIQALLIEDLLDLNRVVSGKLELEKKPVDIKDAANAALDSIAPLAKEKNIMLFAGAGGPPMFVLGDAARLQQVFWNLLSNAVKFTPQGGQITVALEELADDQLKITVADNGRGLSQELVPRVFDRFRRGDEGRAHTERGLGVGLAIVKELVELHGGRVEAASAGVGRGSTFTVYLPRIEQHGRHEKPSASAAENSAMEHNLEGVTVLAIDDEPDALRLMRVILQEHGAHVLGARSAAEAERVMESVKPDVIISDIAMPNEDGCTFLRKVRTLPGPESRTPAIALTAYARDDERLETKESGFQYHLSKPFEHQKLIEAVVSAARQSDRA